MKIEELSQILESVDLELGECNWHVINSFSLVNIQEVNLSLNKEELNDLLFYYIEDNEEIKPSRKKEIEDKMNYFSDSFTLIECEKLNNFLSNKLFQINDTNSILISKQVYSVISKYFDNKIICENEQFIKLKSLVEQLLTGGKLYVEIDETNTKIEFCSHKILFLEKLGIIDYLKTTQTQNTKDLANVLSLILDNEKKDTIRKCLDNLKDIGGTSKAEKNIELIFKKLELKLIKNE